jgi:hypothetical protein
MKKSAIFAAIFVIFFVVASIGPAKGQPPNLISDTIQIDGTVEVTNEPLLVEVNNNEEFVREPFHFSNGGHTFEGFGAEVTFDVPADKLLVIENISANAYLPLQQSATRFQIWYGRGDSGNGFFTKVHFIPFFHQGNTGNNASYTAAQQVRIYVNPGTTVTLRMTRNDDVGGFGFYPNVSGYLIDPDSPNL